MPTPGRLVVRGAGLSHRGRVRTLNEDAILLDPAGALWAVADGMGGHGHGDLAADLVIEAFARIPHGLPQGGGGRTALGAAFRAAQAAVRAAARARGLGVIGAAAVALLLEDAAAAVAWMGDCRAYLLRGGRLARLTRDHSVVQELLDRGEIDARAAEAHPQAHVITRAIGAGGRADPDFAELVLAAGDRLLLCSDGLTRCLPEPAIAGLLDAATGPDAACRDLVAAALAEGAPDNVSAVVVEIARFGPGAAGAAP